MRQLMIILGVIFSLSVSAATHNWYFCEEVYVLDNQCSTCLKKPEGQIDFLLNKSQSSVMVRFYDSDRKVKGSQLYSNCKIFDEQNWDCSYYEDLEMLILHHKIKMVKNSFQSQTVQLFTNGTIRMITNMCAKKRGWFD